MLNVIKLCLEEIGWEEVKHFHLAQPRPLLHSCEHSNEILSCINVGISLTKLGIVSFLWRTTSALCSAVLHSISHHYNCYQIFQTSTLHITYFNIHKRCIYPTKHNFGFSALNNLLCKLPQDQQEEEESILSLSYPACSAHAPYYIVKCLSDCTVFFHIIS
jgi:hypothetical protein